MTVDAATPHDSRFARARRAFRRWRKSRPFWGGLLLILAGLEILYSGNLNLGNIQVHLGLTGFKSYIIPLVIVLCGALAWVTPAQRLFYGIVGTAAVVYSIVSVNLAGFVIGLILGVLGGTLTIAWVPNKRVIAADDEGTADQAGPDDGQFDDDPTADLGEGVPGYNGHDDIVGVDVDKEREGEEREPFRQPRHAVEDDPGPIDPTARTAPDEGSLAETGAPTGQREATPTGPAEGVETTATLSRVRSIPDLPHVRGAADPQASAGRQTPGDDETSGGGKSPAGRSDAAGPAAPVERSDGGRNPRALTITVIALALGAFALFAARNSASAATDACTPTPLQSAIQNAVTKSGVHTPSPTKPKNNGDAALAPVASDQPQPVASLIGGGLGAGSSPAPDVELAGTASSDPSASATATPTVAASPSASVSAAPNPHPTSPGPTSPGPTSPVPTSPGRTSPSATKPSPSTSTAAGATTAPSSSAPACSVIAKALAASTGQPDVNETPSTQKAAMLTMSGLSYDGNVSLPTATGSIEVMQFSMTSSTSTPFELDVPVGDHSITIKSSSLTVKDNVKFYTSEIKGNLLGVVPVDFTPSAPPPVVISETFFTDATLKLVFVRSDTLTASELSITSD